MALSMDEQRILAEIERKLAADDPGLASCLSTFRRPGPGTVLRSPRARIIGSLFTVLLVALVSLMVYAMIPFRDHTVRNPVVSPGQASANSAITSSVTSEPPGTHQATIGATTSGTSRAEATQAKATSATEPPTNP
jgi:Protein of unknown function (DUF3040)